MLASLQGILDWFTGGSIHYMTLYHCMQRDMLWVGITVALDVSVATGYILIAMHWWKNQKRVPATPAREALSNIRNIFIFCGLCGYAFIPVKMFWPAWRLYDMFMAVLVYFTWKYALRAKDLKVVYNELGRSNELSRELEQSRDESRRKTFFLNSLSHDLRTPLNALALHSQVASVSLSSGDTQALRNSLQEIETNARATAELLDSLLQCARLDWSEPPNAMTEFELAPFLGALARANAPAADAKRLALHCECPPGAVIETDRTKLERVLTNLLTNAIKFTSSGSVRLVAECASGALEIHVIDTGMGLSPEQQARLFEEFYQVQNYERDRKKGFGLGLSIARRLARQLGGDIEVDSAIGRGSRFSVLLPGVARPARAADRTAPAANAVGAG
jgi:signal transduction histidine kinase